MKKIKILVSYSDNIGGVGYYRSLIPHIFIGKHNDEFEIDIMQYIPNKGNFEQFYKKYDILHFHKLLDVNSKLIELIRKANKNIKIICDLDDYFLLPKNHPNYISENVMLKNHENVIKCIKLVDAVTTTTNIFAEEIKKYNKNVIVLPNAIDLSQPQYHFAPTKSERIRFGIICGSTHLDDVKLLSNTVNKLNKQTLDKIQFVIGGFCTNGSYVKYMKDGSKSVLPIQPKQTVYYEMEKILTKNYTTISKEHKDFLLSFQENVEDPFDNEPYKRFWSLPVDMYYQLYKNIDVLLAPLVENDFNKMKSQLKLIEAGFSKIPIICQNFGPYTIDTISFLEKDNTINENGNSLLINDNEQDWLKSILFLTENKDYINKIGLNLFNTVQNLYSIEKVSLMRENFYKNIIN